MKKKISNLTISEDRLRRQMLELLSLRAQVAQAELAANRYGSRAKKQTLTEPQKGADVAGGRVQEKELGRAPSATKGATEWSLAAYIRQLD
jgi:hypothetical protein